MLHSFSLLAQNQYESEDKILKDAEKYFKENNYPKAFPLYSQILSLHPRDFNYNFKFGVCLLFANEDPERVVYHLDYATKYEKIDPLAFYYLGRAYHLSYRFDDAISSFETFKKKASSSQLKTLEVDMQIAMCYNAKQLMTNVNDLYVIQKKDVNKVGFFRSYEAQDIGGVILAKASDFTTSADSKLENENAIMYVTKNRDYIYFSSYGKSNENGKDIYRVSKKEDGKWNEPENLGDAINTKYDEDFPYISIDGKTLYFSSKGHNSMGGFDVFKTTWDTINFRWTQPVNLDFAINTPYDDVLFIPDTLERYAFFSSDRTATFDMTSIYKVRIDRRPKVVESVGFQLAESMQNKDEEKLNSVISVIKEKAKLPVNATEEMFVPYDVAEEKVNYETIDINKVSQSNTIIENQYKRTYSFVPVEEIPEIEITENSTNQDIIKSVKVESLKQKFELDELTYKSKAAKDVERNKKSLSAKKYEESNKRREDALLISDESLKNSEIAIADSLFKEAASLKKEAEFVGVIASQLDEKKNQKQKEYDESVSFVKEMEVAQNSKSPEKSNQILAKYNENLTNRPESFDDEQFIGQVTPNQLDFQTQKTEADQLYSEANKFKSEAEDLYADADKLEQDAAGSKKKDTKEMLQNQAKSRKSEADEIMLKYQEVKAKADFAQNKVDSVKNEIVIKQVLFDEVLESADDNYIADNKSNPKLTVAQELKSIGVDYDPNNKKETAQTQSTSESPKEDLKVNSSKLTSEIKKQIDFNEKQYLAALYMSNKKAEQAKSLTIEASSAGETSSPKQIEAKKLLQESIAAYEIANYYSEKNKELEAVYEESKDVEKEINKRIAVNELKSAQAFYTAQEKIVENNEALIYDKTKVKDIISKSADKNFDLANKGFESSMIIESKLASLNKDVEALKTELNDSKTPKAKKDELNLQIQYTEAEIAKKQDALAQSKIASENYMTMSDALKNYSDNSIAKELADNSGKIQKSDIGMTNANSLQKDIASLNKDLAAVELAVADNSKVENSPNSEDKSTDDSKVKQLNPDAVNPNDSESFIDNEKTKETSTSSVNKKSSSNETAKTNSKQNAADNKLNEKSSENANNDAVFADNSKKSNVETNKVVADNNSESSVSSNTDNTSSVVTSAEGKVTESDSETKIKITTTKTDNGNGENTEVTVQNANTEVSQVEPANKETTNSNVSSDTEISMVEPANNSNTTTNANLANKEASGNNDMITIQLAEFTIRASANKETYTVNRRTLNEVRIDANDNSIYTLYNDVEPIFTASQLESEADRYIVKIDSNIALADKETDVEKKRALMADVASWGDLVVSNQNKAIELYKKVRASAQVASADNKSNANSENVSAVETKSNTGEIAKIENTENDSIQNLAIKNRDIFLKNKTTIEGIDKSSKTPDVISLSTLLIEDADVYYESAKANRLEAESADTDKKMLAYKQAYDYEIIAINKQNQAIEILTENKPLAQVVDSQLNNKTQYDIPAPPVKNTTDSSSNVSNVESANSEVNTLSSNNEVVAVNADSKKTNSESSVKNFDDNTTKNNEVKDNNSPNNNASLPVQVKSNVSAPVANIDELLDNKSYEGIVYKIQVAAFKNDVPYSMFNGLTPVSTEKSSNGFTRVMAGVFNSLEDANTSKLLAKQKGFVDAFVVAYLNGKRIPVAQAKESVDKKEAEVAKVSSSIKFDSPVVYASSNGNVGKVEAVVVLDESKDITKKMGLFYTVQVGVFSKPVAIEAMFNINNVYYQKLPNGQIRYYSGVFNDKLAASALKSEIVTKIKDVFVTAYYNGERISLTKATEYEKK